MAARPSIQAEALRAAAGLLQFVVLARVLGASGFGQLALLNLAVGILQPLLTPQVGLALVRASAQGVAERHLLRPLAVAASRAGLLAAPLALLVVSAGPLDVPLHAVWLLWWSELCAMGLLSGLGAIAQGRSQFARYRNLVALAATLRVASAGILLALPTPSIGTWALTLALLSSPAAIGVTAWTYLRAGKPRGPAPRRDGDLWVFSLNAVGLRLCDDIDKALVAAFAGYAAAGVYAAAYRLASYVMVPVRGVLAEFAPALFRTTAATGITGPAWDQVRQAQARVLFVVTLAVAPLSVAAVLAPRLLGSGYEDVTGYALVLVPALGLRGVHYVFGDVLTATGRVRRRLLAQALSLGVPVGTCLLLVPVFGGWGAVAATALGEVLAVALMGHWARKVVDADRRYGGEDHESVRRYSHAR